METATTGRGRAPGSISRTNRCVGEHGSGERAMDVGGSGVGDTGAGVGRRPRGGERRGPVCDDLQHPGVSRARRRQRRGRPEDNGGCDVTEETADARRGSGRVRASGAVVSGEIEVAEENRPAAVGADRREDEAARSDGPDIGGDAKRRDSILATAAARPAGQ